MVELWELGQNSWMYPIYTQTHDNPYVFFFMCCCFFPMTRYEDHLSEWLKHVGVETLGIHCWKLHSPASWCKPVMKHGWKIIVVKTMP